MAMKRLRDKRGERDGQTEETRARDVYGEGCMGSHCKKIVNISVSPVTAVATVAAAVALEVAAAVAATVAAAVAAGSSSINHTRRGSEAKNGD